MEHRLIEFIAYGTSHECLEQGVFASRADSLHELKQQLIAELQAKYAGKVQVFDFGHFWINTKPS